MPPKKGVAVAAAVAEASDDVDAAGSSDGASPAAAKRASSTEDSFSDTTVQPPSPMKKPRAVPGGGRSVSYNGAKTVWNRHAIHFVSSVVVLICMHCTV